MNCLVHFYYLLPFYAVLMVLLGIRSLVKTPLSSRLVL